MKSRNCLLFFFFLSNITSYAQAPSISWAKCYGGSLDDEGKCIIQTWDNGFIFLGAVASSDGDVLSNHANWGSDDIWMVKIDSSGNILWQKCLGGEWGNEIPHSILRCRDGNFMIAGEASSNDGDVSGIHCTFMPPCPFGADPDFWIVKTDSLGNILWQKCFGGSSEDIAYSICETFDNGFIILGQSLSFDGDVTGNHGQDYWVVKTDSAGNLEWEKALGGSNSEIPSTILQAQDSGYIVAGTSGSNDFDVTGNHGLDDYWVVKLGITGNIEWQKCFGGTDVDGTSNMAINETDKSYIICGASSSQDGNVLLNNGSSDIWMIKVDSLGNLQSQKTIGGLNSENGFVNTITSNSFLVGGSSMSSDSVFANNHGLEDFFITALDSIYTVRWGNCFGGSNTDHLNSIIATNDGGAIAIGSTFSHDGDVIGIHNNQGYSDIWLLKLTPFNNVQVQENIPIINNFYSYYNNESICMRFNSKDEGLIKIDLCDITGRTVAINYIEVFEGNNSKEIKIGTVTKGIFIVKLTIGDLGMSSKLIIY